MKKLNFIESFLLVIAVTCTHLVVAQSTTSNSSANNQLYDTEEVPMMKGVSKHFKNGWTVDALFTVAETDNDGTDYSQDRFGYRVPGVLDGMYAFKKGNRKIDLIVTHELQDSRGYPYMLANGTQLTGARITKFRVEQGNDQNIGIRSATLAYNKIYDRYYTEVTNQSQIDEGANPGSLDGMDRLCSANGIEKNKFGFSDDVFITGEEAGNGQGFALDVNNEVLYTIPAMGRAAWESVCVMENFNTNKVVLLIGDDRGGAPLLLYIGVKNSAFHPSAPAFLKRNGLAEGNLYVWVADNGDLTPEDWNGTGTIRNGKFVKINHYNPSMAGQTGYDAAGWANINTQDALGIAAGRFNFSRPEDVHTNPEDGTQAVLASTGLSSLYPSDSWGSTYIIDLKNDELSQALNGPLNQINNLPARLTLVYDGDDAGQGQFSDSDAGLRSPDNLVWANDGYIYINEDRSVAGFCSNTGKEASVWQLNPNDGVLTRILEMDRNAVPFMQLDTNADDCGNWESSGIIDVTNFFQTEPNETLLLLNVQAHSINGSDNLTIGGNEGPNALSEGGQLLFASRKVQPISNEYRTAENYDSDYSEGKLEEEKELIAYPNPADDILHLKTVSNIKLLDAFGNVVIEKKEVKQIDISRLMTGLYVLQTDKGETQKIIIK